MTKRKIRFLLLAILLSAVFVVSGIQIYGELAARQKEKNEFEELAAVVEQALAPFTFQAELRQMTLAVDCRQGQFLGDRLWTVEAVQNIVKNCLEHMGNGGTLRLTGTQTALYCQLVIADDGCGIEKEDLPHIFERFYKGKNAGADSVGIGLALSKSVLNRENATVEVESTVGVGTTFTIRFYRNII